MEVNSGLQIPNILSSDEDNIDITSKLIDSTRLQNKVRKTYLKYLEMILKKNIKKYGNTNNDIEMTRKIAVSLELAAARASMVVALYQRQMKAIISDIKRNTKEGRLHLFCTLTSPPSNDEKTFLDPYIQLSQSDEFEQLSPSPLPNLVESVSHTNDNVLNENFDHEEEISLMNKEEFIDFINLKSVPALKDINILNDIGKNNWNERSNEKELIFDEKTDKQNNPYLTKKSDSVLSLDERLEHIYAGKIPVLSALVQEDTKEDQFIKPADENKRSLPSHNIKNNSNNNSNHHHLIETNPFTYEKEHVEKINKSEQNKKLHKTLIKKKFKKKNICKNKLKIEELFNDLEDPPQQIAPMKKSTEESLDELLERQLEQVHSGIDPFEEEQKQEDIKQRRIDNERLTNHWKHIKKFYSRRQAYRMSIKSEQQIEQIRLLYYQLLGERFDEDMSKLSEQEQSRMVYRKQLAPIIVDNLMHYLKVGNLKNRMAFKTMAKRIAATADDLKMNDKEIVEYIHEMFHDNTTFDSEKEVWKNSPQIHFTVQDLNEANVKVKIEKDGFNIKQEKFY